MKEKPQSYYIKKYFRALPTTFCQGCGNGIILNAFARAVENVGVSQKNILIASGIGCSSWIPSPYFKSDILHTTHGRAIAFATGAKIVNPNLKVVIFTGNGDCAAIGGNHLIHAARRNIEMLVLCINNFVYGMTGGQQAPTTPVRALTTTTPQGNLERPFDLCKLVAAAGATYVARWTTYHVRQLIKAIEIGLQKKGFSFIEIISQCPTYYGRMNNFKDAAEMVMWFKENSSVKGDRKILVGEFVNLP
ncbi:MAG: thiamine pyrophosphate-dependent enzyme [Candidatus Thermoplasmatota archaeon]|nr:thiamine pyrophosphate-dependent enzyme [Candidatus Thermoplasmatota archaeon]